MPCRTREEQRAYQRAWVARRRKDWLEANGPCVRCGSSENLEVDHVDRAQKVSHKVWSWSAVRREAELAKCQVLCQPCHVKKGQEAGDLGQGPRNRTKMHGSMRMYVFEKCRCDACRTWRVRQSQKDRERYQNKKRGQLAIAS
jgi:hypothetical protein